MQSILCGYYETGIHLSMKTTRMANLYNAVTIDALNCVAHASGQKLVAVQGLDNFIIVNTGCTPDIL